jgi:imidazole glycerol-phosphate synthase subunit HisH
MINKKKIGVLNYNAGNIYSICNSLKFIGCDTKIISKLNDIKNIDYLVIPGVGSYGHCVDNLRKNEFYKSINNILKKNQIPSLCICVGLQILGSTSEESPKKKGLNILDFKINKLNNDADNKVPHVGWNEVLFNKNFQYFKKKINYDFYFDHSYALINSKYSLGTTKHKLNFTSLVQYKNILACQFHPEKSQENGLNFLKSFISFYG